jgi:Flp pilus assembly protein TadD
MGDTDRAISAWTRAGAYVQLIQWGTALVRRSQWKNAMEVNMAAVRIAPSEPTPYRNLTTAMNRDLGVDATLAKMISLSIAYPNTPWAYLEAADLTARLGRAGEARVLYEEALRVAPNNPDVQQRAAGRA